MQKRDKPTATTQKEFAEMTLSELRRATREFNKPADLRKFREMTPDERARWERARRGGSARGRPRIGAGTGAVVVPVSMERKLLDRADAYAKQAGMKRSALVVKALEALLEVTDSTRRMT